MNWLAWLLSLISRPVSPIGDKPIPKQPPKPVPGVVPSSGLVAAINAARSANGLGPLKESEAANRAAKLQTDYLAKLDPADHGYNLHIGPAGLRTHDDRLGRVGLMLGVHYSASSENAARSFGFQMQADAVVRLWLDSKVGHRENVLGDWTHAGMAMTQGASGSTYAAAVFLR